MFLPAGRWSYSDFRVCLFVCLYCASVPVWRGLGTSQWRTAPVGWFVCLLMPPRCKLKGSQAMPVRSTIDSRGTALVTQVRERAPEARNAKKRRG